MIATMGEDRSSDLSATSQQEWRASHGVCASLSGKESYHAPPVTCRYWD
jgi:hypothetical protein